MTALAQSPRQDPAHEVADQEGERHEDADAHDRGHEDPRAVAAGHVVLDLGGPAQDPLRIGHGSSSATISTVPAPPSTLTTAPGGITAVARRARRTAGTQSSR